MERSRHRWHFVKEDDPLQYSVLLNDFYEEVHGYCLNHLNHYTEWIKPRGWCHKVILIREQLNYCKHLTRVEPPPKDVERLSESTLHSHGAAYETAKWNGTGKTLKKVRSTLLETLSLHRLGDEYYYIIGERRVLHLKSQKQFPWKCVAKRGQLQVRKVEMHTRAVNTSLGKNRSGLKRSEHPWGPLGGNCLCLHSEAQLPPPLPL